MRIIFVQFTSHIDHILNGDHCESSKGVDLSAPLLVPLPVR